MLITVSYAEEACQLCAHALNMPFRVMSMRTKLYELNNHVRRQSREEATTASSFQNAGGFGACTIVLVFALFF